MPKARTPGRQWRGRRSADASGPARIPAVPLAREFRRKSAAAMDEAVERRLTGKSPGQAPLSVSLEEAEPLRRVRHEKILRVLVVNASHGR
ncbi:hypothetical protein GCM10010222_17300 [Streptomyces tanashiensis]|nr:hypothetical protein GCM10010222_17300 [Streptomyces tanashiensis]